MKKTRKSNINLIDYILLSFILIVFLASAFLIFYYFNYERNSCLNSPLVYSVKEIESRFNGEATGIVTVNLLNNPFPLTITFNSTTVKYFRDSLEVNP